MPKSSLRGRPGTGAPGTRSLSAAARAAAKRSARADGQDSPEPPLAERPFAEPAPSQLTVPEPADERPASEPTAAPGSASKPARGPAGRRNALLSAVLAILIMAGLLAGTLLATAYRQQSRSRQAGAQALAEARKAAPVILSYDYRHLDQDFAAALTHLTGSFRTEYRRTTSTVVAPTAKQYQAVVQATVAQPAAGEEAASVVSAAPDRVVVLLFVNQVTRSTRLTAPRLDLNRVRMTLSRTADGWRVSAVDAL